MCVCAVASGVLLEASCRFWKLGEASARLRCCEVFVRLRCNSLGRVRFRVRAYGFQVPGSSLLFCVDLRVCYPTAHHPYLIRHSSSLYHPRLARSECVLGGRRLNKSSGVTRALKSSGVR